MGHVMSALLLLALTSWGCVTPVDQTPGWKVAAVTAGAPALAAPEWVEQFRAGEPTLVLDEPAYQHAAKERLGRLELRFFVPEGTRHLRVRFAHRLDGMKVDARLLDDWHSRTMPLADGRRFGGDQVQFDWGPSSAREVEVTLHHHLRSKPVVLEWQSGRLEDVSPAFSMALEPGTLAYRHPGEQRIELCNAPGRRLEVERAHLPATGGGGAGSATLTGRAP
jgi:hypothetical protein